MRQYMHQQPLHAPFLPKRSSSAGHNAGVKGRIVNGNLLFVGRDIEVEFLMFRVDKLTIRLPHPCAPQRTRPLAMIELSFFPASLL
jgi:hypothetical protein